MKVKVKLLSRVRLLATPWTTAHQALRPWDFPGRSTGVKKNRYVCIYNWITLLWTWANTTGLITYQIRSVSQSCPTLCDPMNRSTPGLPVHHQPPEFTETHIHWVSDAIQPFTECWHLNYTFPFLVSSPFVWWLSPSINRFHFNHVYYCN